MTSTTFAAVICDADEPCPENTAQEPESSYTMSPRSTTRPLHFWNFGSNSEFLRWPKSINDAKCTVLPSFLASAITSFLFLTFVSCHAGICSSFLHSLSTASLSHPVFWLPWGIGIKLVHKIALVQWIDSVPSKMVFMTFMKSSFHALSRRFVGCNDACTYFVLRVSRVRQVSLYVLPLILEGIAAGIGTSNFLRAFLKNLLRTPHLLDQWSEYRAIFQRCQASVFRLPTVVFFFRCAASGMSSHIYGP